MSTKLVYVDKVAIGTTITSSAIIEGIVRFSDRMVSPEGALAKPVPVINIINPTTVVHNHRYYEMELEMDSDNLTAMRGIPVTSLSSTTRVLRDNSENDRIDYFAVNSINQSGAIVSYVYQTQRVYLTYAGGSVSNRPGTTRNPSVYRFICIGTKTIGTTELTASQSADERYTGIQKITVNGVDVTNILDYSWELVGPDGNDMVAPRFTPNTYAAVGTREDSGKHWKISFTFDTYTTAFNSYISDSTVNTVIPTLVVTLTKSDCTTRTHTYEANKCWVTGYAPSNVSEGDTYHPGVVEIVCIGTRVDS